MRPLSKKLKEQILFDPFYSRCCRHDGNCSGRVTWEHCWTYANRQINEKWAIVPLCWYHHLGAGFEKKFGQWISLGRATEYELKDYPKVNWRQIKENLDKLFENSREVL